MITPYHFEYCDPSDGHLWLSKYGKIWLTTGCILATVVTIPKFHQYGRQYCMMVPYIWLVWSIVDSPIKGVHSFCKNSSKTSSILGWNQNVFHPFSKAEIFWRTFGKINVFM